MIVADNCTLKQISKHFEVLNNWKIQIYIILSLFHNILTFHIGEQPITSYSLQIFATT